MAILKKKTISQEENKEMQVVKQTKEKNSGVVSDGKNIFIIKQPWITEKSYNLSMSGKYAFLVAKTANKSEIKKAIKGLYKVDPISVNMINISGKEKRFGSNKSKSSGYKKAIVTLKEGQKIDIMPT